MSILINKETRVICQGITGNVGQFHTEGCLEYGTQMVGGVNPRKPGTQHLDLPVYGTVEEARRETGAQATVLYVPPPFAGAAIIEAERFHAPTSVMLVHSWGPNDDGYDDYGGFVRALGGVPNIDSISSTHDPTLFLGWVRGDRRWLTY